MRLFINSGEEYKCIMCEKILKMSRKWGSSSLRNHILYIHSVQQKIACPKCGNVYKNMHSLRCHLRRSHNINVQKIKK